MSLPRDHLLATKPRGTRSSSASVRTDRARVVTNAEIVERIDSSDEWIRERSGIVERRMAGDGESVVDMSVAAAEKALAAAGLTAGPRSASSWSPL